MRQRARLFTGYSEFFFFGRLLKAYLLAIFAIGQSCSLFAAYCLLYYFRSHIALCAYPLCIAIENKAHSLQYIVLHAF